MKKEIHITGFIAVLIIAGVALAEVCTGQTGNQKQLQENDATCLLKSFTVKQVGQNNYLNWNVFSSINDYYFLLEKSSDGKIFSTVSIKKGGKSPANLALLFSFVDDIDYGSKTVYRLSAYELHFQERDTQTINLNEKNIFGESQNAIVEVINVYPVFGNMEAGLNN